MPVFENFPYTNFHDLNLDWLLETVTKLRTDMENIVDLNSIKYADPIQWDITAQYETFTVVIDPLTSIAYMSKQPVPAGVGITNTDYWLVIFDLSAFISDYKEAITTNIENNYSSASYSPGDLIWVNGVLKIALTSISPGETFVDGTNVDDISIEDLLKSILNNLYNNVLPPIEDVTQNGFPGARIANHTRYYIDGTTGSDDNPGTLDEPFKTVDKFLSLSNKESELRAYIQSAGTYPITMGDNFSNVNIHIDALVSGVILDFRPTSAETEISVYDSHWKLQGVDISNPLTITGHDQNESLLTAIYFDNCMLNFNCVDLKTLLRGYGTVASISRSSFPCIDFRFGNINITDGTTITNTDPAVTPLTFYNSIIRIIGSFNAYELTAVGTVPYCTLVNCVGHIGVGFLPSLTNTYNIGIKTQMGGVLNITESRLNTIASHATSGNSIDNGTAVLVDQGILKYGSVRYTGTQLQYWSGTAWVRITAL